MTTAAKIDPFWKANPGAQTDAYHSTADELFYGGAAGGGKTWLGIGLALTRHRNSLIVRRQQVDTKGIAEVFRDLPLSAGRWKQVGYGGEFRTPDGRLVEVGGCQHPDDWKKHAGRARDLFVFDEGPQFLEKQYTTLIAWNRTADPIRHPTQRCRVVLGGNPPTRPEEQWVIKRWRAWLDPSAGNKAEPGSLRWYTTIDGSEQEFPDGSPVTHKGLTHYPRSRTFIPARLEDNPALLKTGYASALDALPEPLRSMLRYGDMLAGSEDDAWQLIPTRWVVAATHRWAKGKANTALIPSCIGVDVAMGGSDVTVLCKRYGTWVAPLIKKKGKETPDGASVLALIVAALADGPMTPVNLDAIGVGKSAYDMTQATAVGMKNVKPVVASAATEFVDPRLPQYRFVNTRAGMYWHLRNLLDPEGGEESTRLAIPPDPDLMADLCAPHWFPKLGGVQIESKDDIKERLGRSTDAGDALALACWPGERKKELIWGKT